MNMDFYPLNRTPEMIAKESILRPGLFKECFLAMGVFATSSTFFGSFTAFDQQISRYESITEICRTQVGKFNTVSANILHNADFASSLMMENKAEIGVFQETRKNNVQRIVDAVPGSVATYAPGDYPVDWSSGGLGNTTVSLGPKTTDTMRQINGEVDSVDFLKAFFSGDEEGVANSYKERRATLISTFNAKIDGVKVRLNIMNIHIAGGDIGERQMEKVLQFAKEEMNDSSAINVIYGDTNRTPDELKPEFDKMDKPWVISRIGPTSRDDDRQIDQVIYQPYVKIKSGYYKVDLDSKVLSKKGSDHRAIETSYSLRPIIKIDSLLSK